MLGDRDAPRGGPPAYKFDHEDTLRSHWWDLRRWGKKVFLLVALAVVVVIVIVVAVAVVETRRNRYPNYSTINYSLAQNIAGTDFFDSFDYFTGYDPSFGFVHYVPAEQAAQYNLTYASSSSAILRVDTSVTTDTVPNASTGRFSVRLTSKTQYNSGLFIFDIIHTPIGCGTWPALWLSDPANWPMNGEIDVMEAVDVVSSTANQITLHTSSGCTMSGVKRKETGKVLASSCVNTTNGNAGCGVAAPSSTASFGSTFNSNGGGVVALELREAGIRVWQFARDAVPADVTSKTAPDPSGWGEPTADFPGTSCDVGKHFRNQSIIANIDLCGAWAGQQKVYSGAGCPGTCQDQVANNASAFADAYWEFGEFDIYQAS